jgi:hypothetical protein
MNSDSAVDGKEPDQRIKAEAYAGAGDDERGVEQRGKRVDPRDAGATRARSRQVKAEAIGGGHWWSVLRDPRWVCGAASASVQPKAGVLVTRQLDATDRLRYAPPRDPEAFQAARSFNGGLGPKWNKRF